MPGNYRKRYPTKKRAYKRRTYKKPGWGSTAMKALKLATKVAGFVNTEFKYVETNVSQQVILNTGTIDAGICVPAQGITVNEREGDSIKIKNITFEGAWYRNGQDEICRIIVFIDKENEVINPDDFLENVNTDTAVFSNKNQNNKFDSKTLWDAKFTLTTDHPLARFKKIIKVDQHMHFLAGATTVSNNCIKILFINQAVSTGAKVTYHTHTTYVDN